MKKIIPILVASLVSSTIMAAPLPSTDNLDSDTAKLSYAMGYRTGQAMKAQSITLQPNDFFTGLTDGYKKNKPKLSDSEMQTILINMQKKMVQKMQEQTQAMAATNDEAGKKFLELNAKEPGVVTLPSGLQYKIIKKGSGPIPTATDTVTVNYEGSLINKTIFDSSYKRGEPTKFQVNQVIKGWQDALQLMPEGSTWMLYIPAKLAYGAQSVGAIGPNSTLIFKVELLSVKK